MADDSWFADRGICMLFALPIRAKGWLALLTPVLRSLGSAWISARDAPAFRIVAVAAYLLVSRFKTGRV